MKKYYLFLVVLFVTQTLIAQEGLPFFQNFSSMDYKGHNRNFDITSDNQGRIVVANFEGILVYDRAHWTMFHTNGISRTLCVYKDEKGTVWFGGFNVLGFLVTDNYDLHLEYVVNDSIDTSYGEINAISTYNRAICFRTASGKTYTVENGKPYQRVIPSNVFTGGTSNETINLTQEDGLCSTHINKLHKDNKGGLWGATENGIFCISTEKVFGQYTQNQGLHGEVLSITTYQDELLVGTQEGLYKLNGNRFERFPEIDLACWQLLPNRNGNIMIASANGLFMYGAHGLKQLNDRHTLSVYDETEESVLTGEVSHMHRQYKHGTNETLNDIGNIITLKKVDKGILAQSIYGECYLQKDGETGFKPISSEGYARLKEYTDFEGNTWKPGDNGFGLTFISKNKESFLQNWLNALSDLEIPVVYVHQDRAWVGGEFGVICIDLKEASKEKPKQPQIRFLSMDKKGRNISFSYAADTYYPVGSTLYSYRVNQRSQWSEWTTDQAVSLVNQLPGNYNIQVRVKDVYGNVAETGSYDFNIPYPFYMRWYALLFYLILLIWLISQFFQYRQRKLMRDNLKLESVVETRTVELQTALSDLKNMQKQLLFKEREATTGKLMKGLVDRILNPMNYINNFSHLTLGLAKDLREDIEDENEVMSEDNYEDCMDIIDMMRTNLSKIEEHGLSTTRILKAMEEMLNQQATTHIPVDINEVAVTCEDITRNKYYAKQIREEGIEFNLKQCEKKLIVMAIPEWLNRTLMSIIANSMYGIHKKKSQYPGYKPLLKVDVKQTDNLAIIQIYDNGVGIESNILDKVKDPFFTTKPTSEASGLGLFFCQRAIDEFKGSLEIKSAKNEYTECVISIPLATESEINQKKEVL